MKKLCMTMLALCAAVSAAFCETIDLSSASLTAGQDVNVSGTANVIGADPMCRITVREGGDLTLCQSSDTRMQVIAAGGRINLRRAFSDWRTLPTLWLDASAPDTVSNLYITAGTISATSTDVTLAAQYVYYTNGFPLVNYWFDCREDLRQYKMWSDRGDYAYTISGVGYTTLFANTYPYRVTGGLNGKDYISFGTRSVRQNVSVLTEGGATVSNGGANTCRMFLHNQSSTTANGKVGVPLSPRFAFLVFGSQQGGGTGLLAGNGVSTLVRENSLGAALAPAANIHIWVDGTSVSPTQANVLNGGWQVITLELGRSIQIAGLGAGKMGSDHGGQNYAEIIFVNQELTEKQRQTIEIALAEKWGLSGQYAYPEWATEAVSTIYGSSGTVRLETNARLSGAFAGTIDLNGKSLEIVGDNLPPDASAVSTSHMVGWYDSDENGMTKEGTGTFPAKQVSDGASVNLPKDPATRLNILWNRLNDSYNIGDYALYGQLARAPYLNDTARGIGPVRKWMDFANLTSPSTEYASVENGNVLRFSEINNATTGATAGNTCQQSMRTIMMVQDSVRGGGQPFADGANVNKPVLYASRTGSNAAPGAPIYPSGTHTILTEGRTYLDGNEVDGTEMSFAGRPEVLTVIPTNTFNVVAIGQLGNSQGKSVADGNTTAEIIGEIMMWDCALDDASRQIAEAYLSWKWLGTTTAGYSALTNATVTGAGAVTVANATLLPKFSDGCTADVTLSDGNMAFVLERDVLTGARELGSATLHLPASCVITIACTARPVAGNYALLTCGGITDGTTFSLSASGPGSDNLSLVQTDGGLVLHVVQKGIVISFR